MAMMLEPVTAHAQIFHVNTAQTLQNALTISATNGLNNTIYITNGYYNGNFAYTSSLGDALTIEDEPGVSNNQIVLDGGGVGQVMYLTNTGNFTVQGLTFARNCGGASALRIAGGSNSTILVQNCQFLEPTNAVANGLELDSGLNATVTNCLVVGFPDVTSYGIIISGVTGTVNVQNCIVATNGNFANYDGSEPTLEGVGVYISGAAVVNFLNNVISSNVFGASAYYGFWAYGAGVYLNASAATVAGNVFSSNWVSSSEPALGGGLYQASGSMTLSNNTFIGNRADGFGGGAYCAGTVIPSGNTFIGNTAGVSGGGAYCATTATLTRNTFTGNSSAGGGDGGGGGGVCCATSATLVGNTFTGNFASGGGALGGGAYCSSGGTYTISSNFFTANTAFTGGGLYVSGPTVTFQDNLLVSNSETRASSAGGGVWVDATSSLYFINNTITANTAVGSGGGAAFNVTGTVELLNVYNNIIWGNTASSNGSDVWLGGTGQMKVFDNNDVNDMYGVWNIAQNNINLAPQFFNPIGGDYHTQNNSPCLAAGTTSAPSLPGTDLDGNPRVINGNVDIGCYEFTTNVFHPADTNGDWVISPAEYAAYAAAWQNGQGWTNGPNPISANYVTRAGYLMTNNSGAYYNDGSARPVNWKTNP
jgi:hypothetical protein